VKERLERLRRKHRAVDVVMAVIEKGGQDNAGHLAAVIAFFSFFSLFPLLLVFVWVLGALLDEELQRTLVDSAIGRFPVIGKDIQNNIGELDGGLAPLVIGLAGAVWAGTRAFEGFESAMHVVWHGVFVKGENLLRRKGRAVLMIIAFGIGLSLATAGSAIVTVADWIPGAARPFGFLVSAAMNTVLVGVMYVLSTPGHPGWRRLLPGSILAGTALTLLYSVGTTYLTKVVDGAGDTYGTFAVVIGLLTWLNLIGTVIVWSAELNSVLAGQRAAERAELGR
jgi:YihY family inner membrane protein